MIEKDVEDLKPPINDYISTIYPSLEHIHYNIAVYRTISSFYAVNDTPAIIEDPYKRDFWINTSNNAIQMAIIDWCKVFGSEKDNPYHSHKHLDFTVDDQIRTPMIRFRNKYIAHKDNEPVPVPMLDGAMQAMFELDEKIRELYDLDGYPGLKDCFETYMIRIQNLMEAGEQE